MIEELIRKYPENKAFVLEECRSYSRDVEDIARQHTGTISRDLSDSSSSDIFVGASFDLASSPSDTQYAISSLDWPANNRPASFDDLLSSTLLNQEVLESDIGIFADTEHGAECSDPTSVPSTLNDHLRFEPTVCAFAGMPITHEATSHMTTANSSGTIVPAMLHSGQRDECRTFTPSKNDDHIREHCSQQKIAQKRSSESGKPSQHTKKSRPPPSTGSQDSVVSKRRRVRPSVPHHVELRGAIAKKLKTQNHDVAEDMTNIYLATASSDSLCQLKTLLSDTWGKGSWTMGHISSTMAGTLRMLEKLDNVQQAACFLRRIYLLRLHKLREVIASRFKEDSEDQGHENNQPKMRVVGKVESNILDCVMEDAYPDIDRRPPDADSIHEWRNKHLTERKALKNRFQSAKKWNLLSERFSCGSVALVPSGGQFHIQNQKYAIHCIMKKREVANSRRLETLPEGDFHFLLNLLEEKDNGVVRRMAGLLTPYVQSLVDGKDFSEALGHPDPDALVILCEEELRSSP